MANNNNLKNAVRAVIKENGNNEITGNLLQTTLLSIINHFGSGAVFAGVALPNTVPVELDVNSFYIANANGVYQNFGGYENTDNKFVVFLNNSGVFQKVFEANIKGADGTNGINGDSLLKIWVPGAYPKDAEVRKIIGGKNVSYVNDVEGNETDPELLQGWSKVSSDTPLDVDGGAFSFDLAKQVLGSYIDGSGEPLDLSGGVLGILRNDNTIIADTSSKALLDIPIPEGITRLSFKGYPCVVGQPNQLSQYSGILGITPDGDEVQLLRPNIATAQVLIDVDIDLEGFESISVSWGNYEVSAGTIPNISFYTGEIKSLPDDIDNIKASLGFTESLPKEDLTFEKDYVFDIEELSTNRQLKADLSNAVFGKMNVLKFTGGNVYFSGDFIIDPSSDNYNPSQGNVIYCWYEYRRVRAVIKNSDKLGLRPMDFVETFSASFNVPDQPYNNYQPEIGERPQILYGSFTIANNKLISAAQGDNALSIPLYSTEVEVSFTSDMTGLVVVSLNNDNPTHSNFANIQFERNSGYVLFVRDGGAVQIPTGAYPAGEILVEIKSNLSSRRTSVYMNGLLIGTEVLRMTSSANLILDIYNPSTVRGGLDSIIIKERI